MTTETTRTLEEIEREIEENADTDGDANWAKALVREADANAYARGLAASRASPEEGRLMVDEDVMLSQQGEIARLETALREIAASTSDGIGMRAIARAALRSPPAPAEPGSECTWGQKHPRCPLPADANINCATSCPLDSAPPTEDEGARCIGPCCVMERDPNGNDQGGSK